MGVAGFNHDIKTLFLTVNSIIAASIGLYPISLGLTLLVTSVWPTEVIIGSLFMGTFMIALASLGHYGAIAGKNSILVIYASMVGLLSVVELTLILNFSIHKLTVPLIFLFCITSITMSSVLLAVALSKQIQKTPPPPKTALELPSAPVAV